MTKELTYYKRWITALWIIVGVLLLVIIAFLIHVFEESAGGAGFRGQQNEKIAMGNVGKYRGKLFPKTKGFGVWYDSSDIRHYLDSIYPQLKQSQLEYISQKHLEAAVKDYEFKVGFYWMRIQDPTDKKTRTDFCVVPIWVNKGDPKIVYDYFDDRDSIYSHNVNIHVRTRSGSAPKDDDGDSYAFNTGNMFP